MKHKHLIIFGSVMIVAWAIGTFAYLNYYPHSIYNMLEKSITQKGVDADTSTGIPVNTLHAVSELASPSSSLSRLLTTGNHDTLYVVGWLDLSKGALVLHVPDFSGRYYAVQFTDPSDGTDFAYVGTRTTGTDAGDYLVTGPDWKGQVPQGMKQISSPNNSVLILGRALVYSDSDLPIAYGLTKQIQLAPLSQ
ncbi:MAG TPA: DUF1254 domain-containing protein [Candidatus Paceibacterota bacterium]|nr:DUF1254 domain-containing protein [Candidatus Paceibacterota bacterium]